MRKLYSHKLIYIRIEQYKYNFLYLFSNSNSSFCVRHSLPLLCPHDAMEAWRGMGNCGSAFNLSHIKMRMTFKFLINRSFIQLPICLVKSQWFLHCRTCQRIPHGSHVNKHCLTLSRFGTQISRMKLSAKNVLFDP